MASGDSLFTLIAGFEAAPASLSADLVATAGTSSPAESLVAWSFDDTTIEYVDVPLRIPQHYDGGGVTAHITWGTASATTNTVIFGFAFRRIEDDVDDFDTTAHTYSFTDTASLTPPSVVGEIVYDSVSITSGANMDSCVAGDFAIVRVRRNTADSLVGDARIYTVEFRET